MSNNLSLDQIVATQGAKYQTANDQSGQLDAAISAKADLSVTSSNALTLTNTDLQRYNTFIVDEDGADPADNDITLTFPAIERGVVVIYNATAFNITPTITGQSQTPSVIPASRWGLLACSGSNVICVPGPQTFGIDDNATSTAVTVDSSGNVGIGTVVPDTKLHIDGGNATIVKLEYNDTSGGYGEYLFSDETANKWSVGNARSTHGSNPNMLYVFQHTDASDSTVNLTRFSIDDNGDVGIGTTTPSTKLHVDGPVRSKSYTVITVPSASTSGAGSMIYVTDETGGATPAWSDGTNWRRASDRATIA